MKKLYDTPFKKLLGLIILAVLFIILLFFAFLFSKQTTTTTKPASTPTPSTRQDTSALPTIPEQTIPAPKINIAENVSANKLGDIEYAFFSPSLPNEASIFKIGSRPITREGASEIASSLGFKGGETTEIYNNKTLISWSIEQKNLSITLESGYIEYSDRTIPGKPEVGSPPIPLLSSANEAELIAGDFLKKNGLLQTDATTKAGKAIFFKDAGSDLIQVSKFSDANLVDMTFTTTLDGFDVYQQLGSNSQIHVWVDAFKAVRKMSYKKPAVFSSASRRKIMSFQAAKKLLEELGGIIVEYGYYTKSLPYPESTLITKAFFAYFEDIPGGYVYPIIVFTGTSLPKGQSSSVPIMIYVSALK